MAVIHIVDRTTGKNCASIPVSVHSPSPDELFNEAWAQAVKDNAVDSARRLDYSFTVQQDADQA